MCMCVCVCVCVCLAEAMFITSNNEEVVIKYP